MKTWRWLAMSRTVGGSAGAAGGGGAPGRAMRQVMIAVQQVARIALCTKSSLADGARCSRRGSRIRDGEESSKIRSRIKSRDRKSTRLNSSHGYISYAVFCL